MERPKMAWCELLGMWCDRDTVLAAGYDIRRELRIIDADNTPFAHGALVEASMEIDNLLTNDDVWE